MGVKNKHFKRGSAVKTSMLFSLLVLCVSILILVLYMNRRQIYTQNAQTSACGAPGNPGNEQGVGKYCTKGGGECQGTNSPFCSVDFSPGPALCSKPCTTDNDCGSAAKCVTETLGRGCEPIACIETPSSPTNTPTPTQTPSATPTPTEKPTLTPTIPPTLISTPTPTPTPTTVPSPTRVSGNTTILLKLYFDGIGGGGDRVNASSQLSNKNPVTASRQVSVVVTNSANQVVDTVTGELQYSVKEGFYSGTIDLGNTITTDTYSLTLQTSSFLQDVVANTPITAGQQNAIPVQTLIAGDVNADNILDALDYNIVINCFMGTLSQNACSQTDLNDDGHVDIFDINLLLRELSVAGKK